MDGVVVQDRWKSVGARVFRWKRPRPLGTQFGTGGGLGRIWQEVSHPFCSCFCIAVVPSLKVVTLLEIIRVLLVVVLT
jgi:hypothetical protein